QAVVGGKQRDGELEIELKAANIQIDATDQRQLVVHQHGLGVQQAAIEQQDFHTGLQQHIKIRAAGPADHQRVVLARQQKFDFYAPGSSLAQCFEHGLRRDEVGCTDDDAVVGPVDTGQYSLVDQVAQARAGRNDGQPVTR